MTALHPPLRWEPAPVPLVLVVVTGALYVIGVRRLWAAGRRGRGIRVPQAWAFAGGLAALATALISPLDALADQLLSLHMVQHALLMLVAAPLLVLGRPGLAISAALPPSARRVFRRNQHRPAVARAWNVLAHPLIVWAAMLVVLWSWHLPGLYQTALENGGVHAFEHLCFLVTSFAFWEVAFAPGGRRRLPRGIDVLYVVTGGLAAGAIGALLAFSHAPIYPFYVRTAAALGVSALADQQLAGVVMWVPAGAVSLAIAAALFVGWFRSMERDALRAEAAMGLPPIPPLKVEARP